jgi:uncharacterized protein (DUF58 family)
VIDPAFLDELDRFDAELKRRVSGVFAGEQETTALGEGLTFADYRRYVPGDDTRLIDWKVFGRTDEFYIKRYETERDLTVHSLVDATGSMDYGDGDHHKFEYAAKLGIGFAYLALEDTNDFRFGLFGGGSSEDAPNAVRRLDTGRTDRGELLRLVDECNATDPDGDVDFEAALSGYSNAIGSRSLVLVASDFLVDPDALEAGLAPLASNELVLAHVVAPGERDPPTYGDTVFEGLESARKLRTYFGGRVKHEYEARLNRHVDEVAARADALGARHVLVDTGRDFFGSFVRVWLD